MSYIHSDEMQRLKLWSKRITSADNRSSSELEDGLKIESSSSVDMAKKPILITIESNSKGLESSKRNEDLEFKILCIDLRTLPGYVQFLLCCGAVFVFYLAYGYCQELIFTVEGFKPFGWYLTLMQFAFYSVFGVVEISLKEDRTRKISFKTYLLLAFLTVATMGFSNSSLGYLNYPTQVIFKCCKLIPVLIGGIILQGKKYGLIDVTACLCMTGGLIFFTLADSSVSPMFSLYGVLLISLALCADAVIGNVQEKVMKQTQASNAEVVFYSYALGFVYILIGQLVTAQFFEATMFCFKNPVVFFYTFIFSLTGYLGVNVVLNLVKIYGALIAVTVTTCRKAITICLSFILFTKPFTIQYVWSGFIVVIGIYLNIYSKNKAKWDAQFVSVVHRFWPLRRRLVALQNLQHIV